MVAAFGSLGGDYGTAEVVPFREGAGWDIALLESAQRSRFGAKPRDTSLRSG